MLTARTGRTSAYCPWSYSPRSSPVSRRPVPEMVTPSSSTAFSDGHSRSIGPRTSASGSSAAPASRASSASGCGLASSCSSQTHSGTDPVAMPSSSSRSRPRRTAAGYVVDDGAETTWSAPKASSRSARLSSLLPVSTATQAGDRRQLLRQPGEHGRQPPLPVVADQQDRDVLGPGLARGPRGPVAGRRGGPRTGGVGHGRPQ